jgi:tight adherence protein B
MAVAAAVAAGLGVFYLYTAVVLRWPGVGFGPRLGAVGAGAAGPRRHRGREWLAQAGLAEVPPAEFSAVIAGLAAFGALLGYLLFGAVLPAAVLGGFAGSAPLASYRQRRHRLRRKAQESWPRLIEEIRILTSSAGRSIPQAVFEVGRSGPDELRPAFAAAQREWLLSTDFARTLAVLKTRLADPTVDATCETLLIAHEIGGADLDHRLAALAEDRRLDSRERKDAHAQQAGARLARWFVLIVPLGMAGVGLTVGQGREAYATPLGQVLVVVALAMIVACWIWASLIMRLPAEQRVFP